MKKRIILLAAVLVLVLASSVSIYAVTSLSSINIEKHKEMLISAAKVALMEQKIDEMKTAAGEMASVYNATVSIFNTSGALIYDTNNENSEIISDKKEFLNAVNNGEGSDIRNADGTEYLFAAAANNGFVVRFSVPMHIINEEYRIPAVFVAVFTALCGLILIILTYKFSDYVINPVTELTEVAGALASGRYTKKIAKKYKGELLRLANSLEQIGEKLAKSDLTKPEDVDVETVLNAMTNAVIVIDASGKIIKLNLSAARIFGLLHGSIGKEAEQAIQNRQIIEIIKTVLESGDAQSANIVMNPNSSHEAIVNVRVTKLTKIDGAVAVAEDITELTKLMNMRSDFTANVTHELKTPLTSIRGFVETLIEGVDDPDAAQHFLKIIAAETDRLARLIDDILYLSEIESEKEEAKERINVYECILDTKELLQVEAQERNIELQVYDMSDNLAYVIGSKDKVMQMLVNLVTNGIRYNKPGGGVKIMLETLNQEVIISVADNGIGIPKENIPRLFERFYRVDKGRSRAQGGTGLGLAIVKHIVLSMKGNVSVQSSLGVGSIFTIRLPRA